MMRLLARLGIVASLFGASQFCYAAFNLGGGENYALLFEGVGGNTLQITNVTVNGNVGVATTGKATDSGPSTINGAINFSAANTGQFSNNNASNVITGGVQYSVAGVTSAMNYVNDLSLQLFNIQTANTGTAIAINGTQTINASAGAVFIINGQAVHVFDATSFSNSNAILTINGAATDLVAINLGGLGNIQFHGGIQFTGGITADDVLFNIGGGNYTTQTGNSSLDINNNGGKAGIAQGIFLDPNGAISVTNAVVVGRVFGGDSHDFQYVSGSEIDLPTTVPDTGSTIALLGIAFIGIEGMRRVLLSGKS
jgi:VPDSG-CTERM motif